MSKWLGVLAIVAFGYIAVTTGAAVPRDRDHDRLPDRWERNHHLSTSKASAKHDPDGDRLSNRRELRLRTHPRRTDTDRDRLRDGAEIRRFQTNPRKRDTDGDRLSDWREIRRLRTNPSKRDTDGDGFSDRAEVRRGTNPRDPTSHPRRRSSNPPGNATSAPAGGFPNQPGNVTSAPAGGFPNPASTGVPAGWTPAETRTSTLEVNEAGAVVHDIRLTNGANILVRAPNVTIRRVELQGGTISNQYGAAPANCGTGLLIEDTTFEPEAGQPYTSDPGGVIGEGGYTARRVEIWKRGEGFRASDCGPITIEDTFAYIEGDVWPGCPLDLHSDGVQAFHGRGAALRNNTIIFGNHCGTSPWFVPANQGNTGTYNIDRLLISGGGYVFRQQEPGSVTGLRIVENWFYGPIDNRCSVLSPWEAKIVRIDSNYQVTRVVRHQPCDTEVVG
jgi:Bacterial TSP3 repeat/Clostridial binary toxin B/anthrax toxin PA Ca-binding domain